MDVIKILGIVILSMIGLLLVAGTIAYILVCKMITEILNRKNEDETE